MPQVHVLMGRANPAAGTPNTLYTSPALTKTMLTSLLICNVGTTDDSATIWIVPSAGVAGNGNAIIVSMVVDFGDPYVMNAVPILEAGDFLVVQSAGGNLTFTASGLQIS